MTAWPDLVTTALLGTVRRPLNPSAAPAWAPPGRTERSDDALRLLDLAAAHRTIVAVGQDSDPIPAPPESPEQRHPVAPPSAVRLLEQLLVRPDPTVIGHWLTTCVAYGRTAAPVHWTSLARVASRSTLYDRGTLGRALGEQGRWFLRQNLEWRRLAADAMAVAAAPPPPPRGVPGQLAIDTLAENPELIFEQPDPWPVELVAAAWALVGTGALGDKTKAYAVGVGVRMPAELYPRLADAAAYYLEAPDASPALRRTIRASFLAMEQAAWVRVEIAAAFSDTMINIDRLEIPHV